MVRSTVYSVLPRWPECRVYMYCTDQWSVLATAACHTGHNLQVEEKKDSSNSLHLRRFTIRSKILP